MYVLYSKLMVCYTGHDDSVNLQDIVLTVLLVLCLFAGGVANAKYANDNNDFLDERQSFCDNETRFAYTCDDIETVRNYEAISAVSVCVK